MNKFSLAVPFLLALFLLNVNCDTVNSDPKEEEEVQEILVGLIGNAPAGFWFFDTDSLDLVDSLYLDHTPINLETDSTTNTAFWIDYKASSVENNLYSYNYDNASIGFISTKNSQLLLNENSSIALTYGSELTQAFNPNDLTLLQEDSIGVLMKVIASKENNLFKGVAENSQNLLFLSFSGFDFGIQDSFLLKSLTSNGLFDVALSKDERYLYLTYNEVEHPYELGKFIVYDLETNSLIKEFECGAYAKIVISPDGNNVFLGYTMGFTELIPKHQNIYWYKPDLQVMEIFLDNPDEIGLNGTVVMSDNMIVDNSNSLLYIQLSGNRDKNTGKYSDIIKLDIKTKKVLDIFEIPRDKNGRRSTLLWEFDFMSIHK